MVPPRMVGGQRPEDGQDEKGHDENRHESRASGEDSSGDSDEYACSKPRGEVPVRLAPQPTGGIADISDPGWRQRCACDMDMARVTSPPRVQQLPQKERREEQRNEDGYHHGSYEQRRIVCGIIVCQIRVAS